VYVCIFYISCTLQRIIFLGQEIDDELANQIIGVMLYLDSEDSTKPIYMYVNCPGGSVIAGLAIYDTMQHIKVRAEMCAKLACY
jgi:ATP-dependent Clp protease, protease subunit